MGLGTIRKSVYFRKINVMNVHISIKAREIRKYFPTLTLLECKELFINQAL